MISKKKIMMIRLRAEDVLREEKITKLPIDPFSIAASRGITVEAKPDTASGVSGMLLRHGDTFGILYATHIKNEGFQRFSVAHELGHYFLDGHIDHLMKDGIHESHANFASTDSYELEADHFASGLLMPSELFRSEISRHDPGLAVIMNLACQCKTSLTATAIRYAGLSDYAVAIIISTGQVVDYCFLSERMKLLPDLTWPARGSSVPDNTGTARFNADPKRMRSAKRVEEEVDVANWLGGLRSIMVAEEIVGLGNYGKTLTVLSSPSIGQDNDVDDEDDEENLIESWSPRFRR